LISLFGESATGNFISAALSGVAGIGEMGAVVAGTVAVVKMVGHRPKHLILIRGRRSMASALDRKIRRCNASETISSLPF
jgi:hypothetical protein